MASRSKSSGSPARALVLGGAGMLGHKLWQTLSREVETFVSVRKPAAVYAPLGLFEPTQVVDGVDVSRDADLERALDVARPDVVFNAVGIVKQLREAHDPVLSIEINALLPHRLARICAARGARVVHVSTDCVFSGARGGYRENDAPDPVDLYGRSKLLGEVDAPNAITVRTSMIGREIGTRSGLVEWFLGQRGGRARGFTRAIYSGFTTLELSRILADLALRRPEMTGVWQVASEPIAKFDLLGLVNEAYDLGVKLEPDAQFHCDRSLDSSRFRRATGYSPPSWAAMVAEMRSDPTPYDTWNRQ